jgi:DMSO/TMAO reductase YedYZ heme-binding membrane subunit
MNSRLKNHVSLSIVTAVSLGVAAVVGPAGDQLSIVSAYLCLFLLGAALLIGPLNVFRNGKTLGNSYFRRDVGIWAALNGLLHFYLANVLSMSYEYLAVFVEGSTLPPSPEVRSQLYIWGTILGYVIAVLFIVLLGLSNDRILRKVGVIGWKRLQRLSYAGFIFTCAHAFAFQILESREMLWIMVVSFVTLLVLIGQGYGFAAIKRLAKRAVT